MTTCFAQIFWGLILVFLDLNFNQFDVLPDFLGFVLIAIGCSGLSNVSKNFSTTSLMSWLLVVVAFLGYFLRQNGEILYPAVVLTINCIMIWCLLGGVMDLAMTQQHADIAKNASDRRIAYVASMGISMLSPLFASDSTELTSVLVLVLVIFMVVVMISILHLIHRAKLELAIARLPGSASASN